MTVSHIARAVPPWRTSAPLTECGRNPADYAGEILTLEQAVTRWKREGPARAAYTLCMTCIDRAKTYRTLGGAGHGWHSFETNPVEFLARDTHGPHKDLARRELHALATLAERHADELDALMSDELAARRKATG